MHNSNIDQRWANSVYIGTNETGLEQSRLILEQTKQSNCHIGVSGFYNFDIGYWRKSNFVIIFDINPNQIFFLTKSIQILCQSPNRRTFVDTLIDQISDLSFSINISTDKSYARLKQMDDSNPVVGDEIVQLIYELNRPGSWLATDDSFDHIRKLALNDQISLFCEDIRSIDRLGHILRQNHVVVDTLYLSNVYDWMATETDRQAFNQAVCQLVQPSTLIIEADQRVDMYQYIVTGAKFISRSTDTHH